MRIIAFIMAILFIMPMTAYGAENEPSVSAECAAVVDMKTLDVIYQKNAHMPHSMASTTKIMTSLLAVQSERLEQTVTITSEMLAVNGSSIGLEKGNKITLNDLVIGMLLASGNDAANSTAVFLDGSVKSFVSTMNETADEFGMYDTKFSTPSGLDVGDNHSSAYDMAVLASYALKNDTFKNICSMQSAKINIDSKPITLYNHNKLLSSVDGCIGVKTGYTDKAGRCLVSAVDIGSNTIVCVTLNDGDDWNDHKKLIKYAKTKYKTVKVSNSLTMACVGSSVQSFIASYHTDYQTLEDNVTNYEYYYPFIYAPIKKGDEVGYVMINDDEKMPIIADEDVPLCKNEQSTKKQTTKSEDIWHSLI